jgi:hypothetical protein
MTAEDGRPTLEATIKGPLTDPTIRVDMAKAATNAVKSYLKKTLGGSGAGSGGTTSNSPTSDVADQAKKALGNLFKRH